MKGRGVHSPEPGRDISLGSSRIPRICVLREKHTGLTVTPARRPVPGPPALLPPRPTYAPGPRSGVPAASVLGPLAPGRACRRRHGVCGQLPGGLGPWRPETKARHPPRPTQPKAARVGEGPTRRAGPHGPASGGALTQRMVLLKHPLHGGGEEGTQPALGAAELRAPTTTTTTATAAAVNTRQAGLPAAGA